MHPHVVSLPFLSVSHVLRYDFPSSGKTLLHERMNEMGTLIHREDNNSANVQTMGFQKFNPTVAFEFTFAAINSSKQIKE